MDVSTTRRRNNEEHACHRILERSDDDVREGKFVKEDYWFRVYVHFIEFCVASLGKGIADGGLKVDL